MTNVNPYRFNCKTCTTRCDGVSKGTYLFKNDADYSENKENHIINRINKINGYKAKKCSYEGYPDIEILSEKCNKAFFIEVKAQRRTFMAVERLLPNANLLPSETLALNQSDLLRYFDIFDKTKAKIFILWCLENRPCIVQDGKTNYYYQDVELLRNIYNTYKDNRRFKRRSGFGDIVDGEHKGVVVNYHFSLNEFQPVDLIALLTKGENIND